MFTEHYLSLEVAAERPIVEQLLRDIQGEPDPERQFCSLHPSTAYYTCCLPGTITAADFDALIDFAADPASSPSPHATGAAVDIKLRYAQANLGYVTNCEVPMGHQDADTSALANPDYFEHQARLTQDDEVAQRNRRIFYWIMRGALLADDSGLIVNPTEWWHWSYGDQLWARLTGAPEAFFSFAKPA